MKVATTLRRTGKAGRILTTACLFFFAQRSGGQETIRLYAGPAPGSETWNWDEGTTTKNPTNAAIVYNVTTPTLTLFRPAPAKANGSAVVIVPGGGLRVLLFEKEGVATAKALAQKGITAFVLKYRLRYSKTDDPWKEMMEAMRDSARRGPDTPLVAPLARADVANAVRHVRKNAATYGVDTSRVGLVGFSAGAVLSLNTIYNAELDAVPDFVAANYGVMRTVQKAPFRSKVTPLFIAAAADDSLAPVANSIELFNEWHTAKRPVELHVYARGGHGLNGPPAAAWVDRFAEWLERLGFFQSGAKR